MLIYIIFTTVNEVGTASILIFKMTKLRHREDM